MTDASQQPTRDLALDDSVVRLLGTAHVSKASAEAVAREIAEGDPSTVSITLTIVGPVEVDGVSIIAQR